MRESNFVFARPDGKTPWPDGILADYMKPTAKAASIGEIGWYAFRHTYSTLLHALGTKPAVQKEPLRHANIQTTVNLYIQAMSEDKREAVSKLVGVLWKN